MRHLKLTRVDQSVACAALERATTNAPWRHDNENDDSDEDTRLFRRPPRGGLYARCAIVGAHSQQLRLGAWSALIDRADLVLRVVPRNAADAPHAGTRGGVRHVMRDELRARGNDSRDVLFSCDAATRLPSGAVGDTRLRRWCGDLRDSQRVMLRRDARHASASAARALPLFVLTVTALVHCERIELFGVAAADAAQRHVDALSVCVAPHRVVRYVHPVRYCDALAENDADNDSDEESYDACVARHRDAQDAWRVRVRAWQQHATPFLRAHQPVPCGATHSFALLASKLFGSQLLRGAMLARALAARIGARRVHLFESNQAFLARREPFAPHTICVCVKACEERRVAEHCRRLGGEFWMETVDAQPLLQPGWSTQRQWIDGFIVNNYEQRALYVANGARRAIVQQHHHTNAFGLVKRSVARRPRTLAWLGSSVNDPGDAVHAALRAMAARRRMRYRVLRPEFGKAAPDARDAADPFAQRRFHAQAHDADVDVAMLWPPPNATMRALTLRPVTRLVFWWSHGVPAIVYPYASYAEVARDANYTATLATTLGDVERRLAALADDAALRQRLRARGLAYAALLSLNSSAYRYINAFC